MIPVVKSARRRKDLLFAQEDTDKQCSPFSLALMIILHSNNAKQM